MWWYDDDAPLTLTLIQSCAWPGFTAAAFAYVDERADDRSDHGVAECVCF